MATAQIRGKNAADIGIGIGLAILIGYSVITSRIILGTIVLLVVMTIYLPIREERRDLVEALFLGWGVVIAVFLVSGGKYMPLTLLLGIIAYLGLLLWNLD